METLSIFPADDNRPNCWLPLQLELGAAALKMLARRSDRGSLQEDGCDPRLRPRALAEPANASSGPAEGLMNALVWLWRLGIVRMVGLVVVGPGHDL
jgi:hypothetical protein